MNHLPRLALATPALGPEPSLVGLAWLAGLAEKRWRVQHFRSRACPTATEAVGQASGLPGRHLDAWLMPDDVCRQVFARGARRADLTIVEGVLDESIASLECGHHDRPGGLAPLVRALDLPVVGVVTCGSWRDFHLPRLADEVEAVVLDGLESPEDFERFRRLVGLTLKRPVLGAVEALPEVRAALREAPRDRPLPEDLFPKLAASFLKFADLGAIRSLARGRSFSWPAVEPTPREPGRFRVAYARDEAFGAYFPDTLETLAALGAELIEFSPLRDESLPEAVDLVMIGCGFPDLHADALAENLSLITALQMHVCRGQRIYSEGGGTAYLGRSMLLEQGRQVPGAGILPFDAELLAHPPAPGPVTRTLTRDSWLGARGTTVRGYRSSRWRLIPGAVPRGCPTCFGALDASGDFYHHHHAVGGLLHLHLGALAEVVNAFAGPHRPSLTLPSAQR